MSKNYKNAVDKLKMSEDFKENTINAMKNAAESKRPAISRSAVAAVSAAAAVAVISLAAWGVFGQQGTLPVARETTGTEPTNAMTEETLKLPDFESQKYLTKNIIVENPTPYKSTAPYEWDVWWDIQNDYQRERRNDAEDKAFEEALKKFSYKSTSEVLKASTDGKNVCFSPVSYYYALSMATCGAGGETQEELMKALCMDGMTEDEMAENSRKAYLKMNHDFKGNIGMLSNSIWFNEEVMDGYGKDFAEQMKDKYYASIFYRKFDNDGTEMLQDWVSKTTNGFLKNYKGRLSPEQAMHIVNTLYCKVGWEYPPPFKKKYNEMLPFYYSDGTVEEVEFMHTGMWDDYIKGDGYQGCYLETSSGKMKFILPDEGVSVNSLIDTPEKLEKLAETDWNNPIYAQITMNLPKFDMSSEFSLTESLAAMGASKALSPETADFSGISPKNLYIDQIIQNTRIAIDEDGVEAAAVTDIMMGEGLAPQSPLPVTLTFDRPFLFILEHDGYPAFIGIVECPK